MFNPFIKISNYVVIFSLVGAGMQQTVFAHDCNVSKPNFTSTQPLLRENKDTLNSDIAKALEQMNDPTIQSPQRPTPGCCTGVGLDISCCAEFIDKLK